MSLNNVILLLACGSLSLILAGLIRQQDRNVTFEHLNLEGRLRAPLLHIQDSSLEASSHTSNSSKVLLIHGLAASKSALTFMGTELARWGLDCFLVDLPGHGASPEIFSRTASLQAVQEAIEKILAKPSGVLSGSQPSLILIGHSFGAGVAIEAARLDPRIKGVVAISPASEPVSRQEPPQLLILLGEFDFPFVRRGAAFIFEEGTGVRLPPLDSPALWENHERTRRLVVLPWTDHSQGIFNPKSFAEIQAWITRLSPATEFVSKTPWPSWIRLRVRAFFCISLLLLWIPVSGMLGTLLGIKRDWDSANYSMTRSPWNKLPLLWIYAIAGTVAIPVLALFDPWAHLRLMGGGYLSGFLFVIGILGCMINKPLWQEIRFSWRGALYSLLAALFIAGLIAPFISQHFVFLNPIPNRLWRIPWITLSVLPFYLFDEWICRCRLQAHGWIRLTLFHLSSRLILAMILLLGFFVLHNSQFLIVLVLPGLSLMSILCWSCASRIYRHSGSAATTALFSALVTAWFFSAFFTQT